MADYLTANPPPPGDDGREVELQTSATHVQWRYIGDATWLDLVPLSVISGNDGLSAELRTTATHVQWRQAGGAWADLIPLASLVGPTGPPNALAIGTVTTGAPGSAADASISGAAPSQVLNLTLPAGATGAVSAWEYYAAGRPDVVGTLDAAALAWRNAAPNGAKFHSTDGPQGCWEWQKRGGSWLIVAMDTGWRYAVDSDMLNGYTRHLPIVQYSPMIRRIDNQVFFSGSIGSIQAGKSNGGGFLPLPVGFRPANSTSIGRLFGYSGFPNQAGTMLLATGTQIEFPYPAHIDASMTGGYAVFPPWITKDAPPTTMPYTAFS